MSKSKGNLEFVSRLRAEGVDPVAIRAAILAHHYRADWDWSRDALTEAERRLARWRDAVSREGGPDPEPVLREVREALADDLDAPAALRAIDRWAEEQLTNGGEVRGAPGVVARTADALLGLRL
jgi:L-cysteine:1D-myo-inositol 2-amino-2-deoxy-alpha-D-glucopyranoside ligase